MVTTFQKIVYYSGCHRIYENPNSEYPKFRLIFRIWHPVTWILVAVAFILDKIYKDPDPIMPYFKYRLLPELRKNTKWVTISEAERLQDGDEIIRRLKGK